MLFSKIKSIGVFATFQNMVNTAKRELPTFRRIFSNSTSEVFDQSQ